MAELPNTAGLGSLSTLTGTLQGGLSNIINTGSSYIDAWFPPEKREALKGKLAKFATERPYLASFLLSQIALSGPALALFIIMSITVAIFALIAGVLVGLIGALLFIVFAVGVALLFLLPTLFFTTFAAVFIFLWGLGAYYIVKWFNQKDVPGIHVPMKDGVAKQAGLDGVPLLGTGGDPTPERPARERKKGGHANGEEDKENKPPKLPNSNSTAVEKQAGSVGKQVSGNVGDVKKKVGGVTGVVGL